MKLWVKKLSVVVFGLGLVVILIVCGSNISSSLKFNDFGL